MARLKLWPSEAHLRAGDADRDRVADELTRHCAEGRLNADELSQRIDIALRARTLGELKDLTRELPRLPMAPARPRPRRWRRAGSVAAGLVLLVLAALGVGFVELLSQEPVAAMLVLFVLLACALLVVAALGSLLATLAPLVALGLAARWAGRRVTAALDARSPQTPLGP